MRTKKRFSLSTTQIILLSFLLVILVGSVLLSLPISAADGQSIPYIDALFTATTATCVTGLVTVTTAVTWSTFGHAVILLLIQIGGLGVITVVSWLMLLMHRKLGLKDNLLLQDAFNLSTLSGLAKFVKKVVLGTLVVEGVGAALYMLVFIPQFGLRGIWISVFTAVSAFCNAGIDILGDSSLYAYATHPLINFVTMGLIVLGGLGYIVWWDLARVWRRHPRRRWRYLTLHSKIVLSTTALLIFGGAALIFAAEYANPATIGGMSLWDKLQVSLFQSVTTRTAGFASIPQENLTGGGALISLLLMFVGGSPVGTAGGIKTTTLAVLIATAFCTITGRQQVSLHQRNLSPAVLRKAVAVAGMSLTILFLSTLGLALVTDAPLVQILYETTSATATVGLTQNLTPLLNRWGKAILIATMYFGRIGPISLAIALGTRKECVNNIQNPTEEISVG
ncbi:MAG: potassium transporter KtrB [Ruminococcaceae bacterium]|nr:potassium transporter KtrB [Oscillospiraceae bacterium]